MVNHPTVEVKHVEPSPWGFLQTALPEHGVRFDKASREMRNTGDACPLGTKTQCAPPSVATDQAGDQPAAGAPLSEKPAKASCRLSPANNRSCLALVCRCQLLTRPVLCQAVHVPIIETCQVHQTIEQALMHSLALLVVKVPDVASPSVIIGACWLLQVAEKLNTGNIGLQDWFLLFHTALLISSKMHIDGGHTHINRYFAEAMNITVKELATLEIELLYMVDFTVAMRATLYYPYALWMYNIARGIGKAACDFMETWLLVTGEAGVSLNACEQEWRPLKDVVPSTSNAFSFLEARVVGPHAAAEGGMIAFAPIADDDREADAEELVDVGMCSFLSSGEGDYRTGQVTTGVSAGLSESKNVHLSPSINVNSSFPDAGHDVQMAAFSAVWPLMSPQHENTVNAARRMSSPEHIASPSVDHPKNSAEHSLCSLRCELCDSLSVSGKQWEKAPCGCPVCASPPRRYEHPLVWFFEPTSRLFSRRHCSTDVSASPFLSNSRQHDSDASHDCGACLRPAGRPASTFDRQVDSSDNDVDENLDLPLQPSLCSSLAFFQEASLKIGSPWSGDEAEAAQPRTCDGNAGELLPNQRRLKRTLLLQEDDFCPHDDSPHHSASLPPQNMSLTSLQSRDATRLRSKRGFFAESVESSSPNLNVECGQSDRP